MALITSATETEALSQYQASAASDRSSKKTEDFSDVLDQAFSVTSEDMDTIFEEAEAVRSASQSAESGGRPNPVLTPMRFPVQGRWA